MASSGAPLILIAAADDAVRQRLVADVEHRFGADYAVVGAVSGGAALDCVRGRPDAVTAVIARRWLPGSGGGGRMRYPPSSPAAGSRTWPASTSPHRPTGPPPPRSASCSSRRSTVCA